MIKKINIIQDVSSFIRQFTESEFIFLNTSKLLSFYKDGLHGILLNDKIEIAEVWRDGYLINEIQFYCNGKSEFLFEENIFAALIINNEELLVKNLDFKKEEVTYGIFNYFSKNIKWLSNLNGHQPRLISEQNKLISTTDKTMNSFSFEKGKLWEKLLQVLQILRHPV